MGIQQRDPPKVSMAPPDRVKSSRGKAHALALALVALALALDWVLAKFLEDNSFGFVGLGLPYRYIGFRVYTACGFHIAAFHASIPKHTTSEASNSEFVKGNSCLRNLQPCWFASEHREKTDQGFCVLRRISPRMLFQVCFGFGQ